MKYEWIEDYCLAKTGVAKEFKPEWQAVRYLVGGKQFAMQGGDKYGKPIITLKLEPGHGMALRERYEHIVPGYYSNKEHWNSLYLEGDVPDDVVRGMLDEAYRLVLASLTKKLREQIIQEM